MESPAAFSISLPPEFYEDLDERIKRFVSEAISGNQNESKKYLTRKEVCEKLNISLPTLSRYISKGLINAQRIGNRILIDADKLQNSLQELPVKLNNR